MLNSALTEIVNPMQTTFGQTSSGNPREVSMVQLCIMVMVLGAVMLIALPAPRHRIIALFSRGAGMGMFGAGLAGLLWNLAVPYV
jgi:hypothetical protein